jgi:hemoglobin/transferrin/lactoferrin receptor protein
MHGYFFKIAYMRIVFTIYSLCLLFSHTLNAQVIQVKNERTAVPIPQVLIYDSLSQHTVLTDLQGKADVSAFKDNSVLFFQHPSYELFSVSRSGLPTTIYLSEKIIQTDQVVISANKWEQELSGIPQDIIAIEETQIAFRNPATAADLLSQSGEIYVQKSQLGGGSPSLRGFAANSVLLVFDGVRMNNAIYRSGNLQNVISIDPLVLEGVEILQGSGAVMYGSDALGGVLDFHSKTPEITSENKILFVPDVMIRYASASQEKTIHGSLQISSKKWASFTSFSYTDFNDLKTGKNKDPDYPEYGRYPFIVGQDNGGHDIIIDSPDYLQEPTGYESQSFMQKVLFVPTPDIELVYSLYHNTTGNIPRFDRLIETDEEGIPVFASWYYGPQRWTMHSLRTTFFNANSMYDRFRVLAAYQHYEESRFDRRFNSPSLRKQQENLDIASLSLDAEKSLPSGINFYYGAEGIRNWVSSDASRRDIFSENTSPTTPRYPDGGSTYSSLAAYLSMTKTVSPQVNLTGGFRYTHIWLDATTLDEDAIILGARNLHLSNGAVNGHLGATWKINQHHHLRGLLSSGFRAPNVDDVGKIFELDGNDLVIPNNELEPEKTRNIELSYRYDRKGLTLESTFFYTYLTNAIVRGLATLNGSDSIFFNDSYRTLYAQVNASAAYIYGASFRGTYQFIDNLAITGTVTYTNGEEKNTREPLRHTTPLFGNITMTWLLKAVKLEAFLDFNGNRFREDIPSSEIDSKPYLYAMHISDNSLDGSPGWYTLNIRGSWQVIPSLAVNAAVENILDRHYRPYSSGISAPGRNITLSLRYRPF